MGLFDNLFLDANTAVTINDGVDHSKDVVQPIIEPVPLSGKGDDGTGGTQDPKAGGKDPKDDKKDTEEKTPKKDDSLDTLFDADDAEEKASAKILAPEPPKDIALEIGLGPAPLTPESTDTPADTFDIGGDVSFDIGGDISLSNDTPIDTVSPLPDTSVVPGVIEETTMTIDTETPGETSPVEALTEDPLVEVALDAPAGNIESSREISNLGTPLENAPEEIQSATPGNTSSENALFSLLNTDDVTSEALPEATVEAIQNNSTPTSDDSLFGIMADTLDPVAPDKAITENNTVDENVSPEIITDNSAIVSQAPKLKAKLSEFLSELETMEVGDEAAKSHKFEQIEMCRQRISEIQIEYDARISALKTEMQALEREIAEMDSEKNHIKNVIQTFQKELEVV